MNNEKVIKKTLNDGEKLVYEFSIGKVYIMLVYVFWCIIALLFAFMSIKLTVVAIFIFSFLAFFYIPKSNIYLLTNRRVIVHRGWLSTHTVSISYENITDMIVEDPFFSRIFTNTGHIAIDTAGTYSDEVYLKHIESPYKLKKMIEKLSRNN